MKKIEHSPTRIYITENPDNVLSVRQYYSVNTFDGTDQVTVWNPTGSGSSDYITINISKPKSSIMYLYHRVVRLLPSRNLLNAIR